MLAADRRDGLDEAAWAAVHGLSTLLLDGPLSGLDDARRQLIIDRLLDEQVRLLVPARLQCLTNTSVRGRRW